MIVLVHVRPHVKQGRISLPRRDIFFMNLLVLVWGHTKGSSVQPGRRTVATLGCCMPQPWPNRVRISYNQIRLAKWTILNPGTPGSMTMQSNCNKLQSENFAWSLYFNEIKKSYFQYFNFWSHMFTKNHNFFKIVGKHLKLLWVFERKCDKNPYQLQYVLK